MYIKTLITVFLTALHCTAQVTTGNIYGTVQTATGEFLNGAVISVIHEPTGTVYITQSRSGGYYQMDNLTPGGPYTITVSFINFRTEKQKDIPILLGESKKINLVLFSKEDTLRNVIVTTRRNSNMVQWRRIIDQDKINHPPSASHTLFDYLYRVPLVNAVPGNENAVSIAGQNNRFNSFFIDGAISNDVFGLAASGMNGGQTGAAPVSIEALEQLQVMVSPYDVSVGNFTGGAINAVTRSGHNTTESAMYGSVNNRAPANLTGETAVNYTAFQNTTNGLWSGGAIIKNRLFYFFSYEEQNDQAQQLFAINTYNGNTTAPGLQGLTDVVKKLYGYDPGNDAPPVRTLFSQRMSVKLDNNINDHHKLSVSFRSNHSVAVLPGFSSPGVIHFSNDGIILPNQTTSVSAELKSILHNINNRLLLTYTNVSDHRSFTGAAFPRVSVTDGNGSIVFGSEPNSTQNRLLQNNIGLIDIAKLANVHHTLTAGVDMEYANDRNLFIQQSFGAYDYSSVAAFENNSYPPIFYKRSLGFDNVLNDQTQAIAKFSVLKMAVFISDEIHASENLDLLFGLRADKWQFLQRPATDTFFNEQVLPELQKYYDTKNAQSGQRPSFPIALSPRFSFVFTIPSVGITLRGGTGIFSGRIPLAWPGGVYNNNGRMTENLVATGASPNPLFFKWNSTHPSDAVWNPGDQVAAITRGSMNLVAPGFHLPSLLRSSFAIDKKTKSGWNFTAEIMVSKNLYETDYTNLNLLPSSGISAAPGSRNVYTQGDLGLPARIPVPPSNPYESVILLSNHDTNPKGYAYNLLLHATHDFRNGFTAEGSYSSGTSFVWHEGTSSVNTSQWQNMESVNGRNKIQRSISDFSPGQKLYMALYKKIKGPGSKSVFSFAISYTGQSGELFSYVYSGKTVTGDASREGFYDLIYIPAAADLDNMIFLPNTINGISYTPQQQKNALNTFIGRDVYLNTHRGTFAQRNAARLSFMHSVDLKIMEELSIHVYKKNYHVQLDFDLFNLANLLNPAWGKIQYAAFNQVALIGFAGYTASQVPQYQFDPSFLRVPPYQTENVEARYWSGRLGLKFTF